MNQMPFFSVIIPVYNKEKFIEKTLESVLNQTFTDFEVIVINDCSTDGSLEKVRKFIFENLKIIQHDKNRGLSATRNTGIKNSNGVVMAFLDADDTWDSGYLEKIHSLHIEFPEAKLLATNYTDVIDQNVMITPKNFYIPLENDIIVEDFFKINCSKPIYFPGSFCVFKSVFETIGLYDEAITFAEDVDFNIRANSKYKLAYSPKSFVKYTQFSENQITNSSFKNKVIPDLNKYESLSNNNRSLKKYLDFNRYIFAKMYNLENCSEEAKKLLKEIDFNSLNISQKILLKTPSFILIILKKIKLYFLKKGIIISSYYYKPR